MMPTRFWKIATTEQKLAQIDGAIELGLTSKQCAFNCGTTDGAVRGFGYKHGRHFPGGGEQAVRKKAIAARENIKSAVVTSTRAYCERRGLDPSNNASARIFPDDQRRTNLFDPIPYEEEVFT